MARRRVFSETYNRTYVRLYDCVRLLEIERYRFVSIKILIGALFFKGSCRRESPAIMLTVHYSLVSANELTNHEY